MIGSAIAAAGKSGAEVTPLPKREDAA